MSWLAAFFNVWGMVLSGKKNILCWPVWMMASLAWIIYGWMTGQWAIVILDATMFFQQAWAYREWRKDECRSTNSVVNKGTFSTCWDEWQTHRNPQPAPSAEAQVSERMPILGDECLGNSLVRHWEWTHRKWQTHESNSHIIDSIRMDE